MATKVTRSRPQGIPDENSVAEKARRLLEQRAAERAARNKPPARSGNAEAQALMQRNREPVLFHTEECDDAGNLHMKAGRPREYSFQAKVRIYGPLPDQWDVNDILVDALRDARDRAKAKYGADIWTSLLIERDPDYEGKVEKEV